VNQQIADREDSVRTPREPQQFSREGGAEFSPSGLLRNRGMWIAALCVLAVIAYVWISGIRARAAAARAAAAAAHQTVPVAATAAKNGDLNLYVTAIGTVTAFNTVTVKTRVDGQIVQIPFKEGQMVRAGDLLVQIDPRPYQVQLTEAEGQMARDKANLVNAETLLTRDKELFAQNIIAKQDLDNQAAQVGTYEGTVKNDQGLIDAAKLNLTYSRITAPISGRIGLRLVDIGNIVHATDTTGLVVITQLQPIAVDFSIPEDELPRVLNAMKNVASVGGGQTVPVSQSQATPGIAEPPLPAGLPVEAFDRDFKSKLATGVLLTTDNEIDQTTGTIKLKAQFPNEDNSLFPNQFVNVRLLVDVQRQALLIPTAAIQRSSQGSYIYVVMQNQTVQMRPVKILHTQGELSSIESGVQPGELVVVDGVDKLRSGSRVTVQLAANPITPGATQ
jgi:membrane fusion protein, multidrug efflux system